MPENPVEILDFYSNGVDDVWVFNCDKLFIEKCIKTHKLVKTNDLDYIIKNIFYISNINFDINLRDYIIYVSTSGKINLFLIHRKPTEEKIYSFVLIIRAWLVNSSLSQGLAAKSQIDIFWGQMRWWNQALFSCFFSKRRRILIANATGVNLFEILLIEFVRC